jgi:hypothetical protein
MPNNFEKIKSKNHHRAEEGDFSQEVWELLDRFDAGDPDVIEVAPPLTDRIKSAEVRSDGEEKTFLTFGLGGCNGVFIFTEQKSGLRNATLAHYSELKTPVAIDEIRKELEQRPRMKEAIIKQAILLAPGMAVKDPATGEEVMRVATTKFTDEIAEAIREELGEETEIKIEPYPEERKDDEKDFGVFVVHVPSADRGMVSYRTWFSGGEIESAKAEK